MSGHDSNSNSSSRTPGGLMASCAVLIAVMSLAGGSFAFWAGSVYGREGVYSAALAWLLCGGSALIALIVSATFAHTAHAMSANLGTMLVRMGAPLVGLTFLPQAFPALAQAGLSTAILLLYFVGLVSETLLALRHAAPAVAAGGMTAKTGSRSSGKPLEA